MRNRIFKELFRCALDFILPQSCLVCGREIEGDPVCPDCLNLIPVVPAPYCPVCGRPTRKVRSQMPVPTCRYCRREEHLDRGRSWTLFVPPLDKIVHHFKYRRARRLGRIMGLGMAAVVKHDFYLKDSDLVMPVPLYWWKHARRGYNQSLILAEVIERECGIPVRDGLIRIRATRTQTRLSETRRRDNVRAAFRVKGNDIAGKKVLLVDDVMTTGATIRECSRALKEAGCDRVYSIVCAIAPG